MSTRMERCTTSLLTSGELRLREWKQRTTLCDLWHAVCSLKCTQGPFPAVSEARLFKLRFPQRFAKRCNSSLEAADYSITVGSTIAGKQGGDAFWLPGCVLWYIHRHWGVEILLTDWGNINEWHHNTLSSMKWLYFSPSLRSFCWSLSHDLRFVPLQAALVRCRVTALID